MSADDIRRLDADRAILVPERQNPLLAWRVVYFEDPVFKAIYSAQNGPLPFPVRQDPEVVVLRREVSELREAVKAQAAKANFGYRAEVAGAASEIAANSAGKVPEASGDEPEGREVAEENMPEASETTLLARMGALGSKLEFDHSVD